MKKLALILVILLLIAAVLYYFLNQGYERFVLAGESQHWKVSIDYSHSKDSYSERLLVQYKGINSEKIKDIECDFSYDDGEDHLITSDKLDESGCLKMNFGGTGEIINKGDVVDLTIKWDGRSEKVDLK